MMKKIFVLLLSLLLVMGIACAGWTPNNDPDAYDKAKASAQDSYPESSGWTASSDESAYENAKESAQSTYPESSGWTPNNDADAYDNAKNAAHGSAQPNYPENKNTDRDPRPAETDDSNGHDTDCHSKADCYNTAHEQPPDLPHDETIEVENEEPDSYDWEVKKEEQEPYVYSEFIDEDMVTYTINTGKKIKKPATEEKKSESNWMPSTDPEAYDKAKGSAKNATSSPGWTKSNDSSAYDKAKDNAKGSYSNNNGWTPSTDPNAYDKAKSGTSEENENKQKSAEIDQKGTNTTTIVAPDILGSFYKMIMELFGQ